MCFLLRFGKIEGVKRLPQKYPNVGVAAFIDFYDVQSAIKAHETQHKLNGNDLRTNFKAKATEKYDANKKRVNESPEKASKDQQRTQGRYRAVLFVHCVENQVNIVWQLRVLIFSNGTSKYDCS